MASNTDYDVTARVLVETGHLVRIGQFGRMTRQGTLYHMDTESPWNSDGVPLPLTIDEVLEWAKFFGALAAQLAPEKTSVVEAESAGTRENYRGQRK